MREIRTYGSEGGETPQGVFPTLVNTSGGRGSPVMVENLREFNIKFVLNLRFRIIKIKRGRVATSVGILKGAAHS